MAVALASSGKARLSARGAGIRKTFGIPADELLVVMDGQYTWNLIPAWKQYTGTDGAVVHTDPSDIESPTKPGGAPDFVGHMVDVLAG